MKKQKLLLICVLAALLLTALAVALCLWQSTGPEPEKGGWVLRENGRSYLDGQGQPLLGWQQIDGGSCYFDPQTGLLCTGWLRLPEGTYYLDPSGRRLEGWLNLDSNRYYFARDGKMVTGWLDFPDGAVRYFGADGAMTVGFLTLDGSRFCFDANGDLYMGWQELEGWRYFFGAGGAMVTGLLETPEGTFFLDEEGRMTTGWQDTPLGPRHFSKNGSMTTGWLREPSGLLYLDETGASVTGWITTGEGRWFLQENGQLRTGWYQTDSARYYFAEDGKMVTGFATVDGIDRYFSSDGNYVPLVNFENPVPEDYRHQLTELEGFRVDSTCAPWLEQLLAAARAEGLKCELNSTYRNIGTQQYLWDRRYNDYLSQGYDEAEAYRLTARRVAYPGTSEHHLGLAIDIVGTDKLYQWFLDHSWEYGFTVRYREDKEGLTGVKDEPWHLRYVGTEIARLLWEQDLCLEEFWNEMKSL